MKALSALAVLVFAHTAGFAQDAGLEIMGFDVLEIIGTISSGLKGIGLVPDLQSFGAPETKAFFVVLLLMWMVFSVAVGLGDLPSAILAFFLSSLAFNHVPSLFVLTTAQGVFEYVFSALFIFVWVDYLLRYMWGITATTKLLLDAAVTMVAVMFLNFTNIYAVISGWVQSMLSVVGFVMFMVFMLGMRIFNAYFSLMNVSEARGLRRAGGPAVVQSSKAVETLEKGMRRVRR
jgi:hypothetical protein